MRTIYSINRIQSNQNEIILEDLEGTIIKIPRAVFLSLKSWIIKEAENFRNNSPKITDGCGSTGWKPK